MSDLSGPAAALMLIVGFVVLVGAGEALVRGATVMARRAGMAPLIIGLTIVAFGTSAPELVVSAEAVMTGAPTLALGNIVGSNIANVFLVLGLPAIFAPVQPALSAGGVRRNAVIGLLGALLLTGFVALGTIEQIHGVILFAGIILYLAYMGYLATRPQPDAVAAAFADVDDDESLPKGWLRIWMFVLVGVVGLPIGGWLIVHSGVQLANKLDVAPELIGLSAVALGTSLPELAATTSAVLRRQSGLAIGNVLGSNIFNIFAVGGVAAMIGDIPAPSEFLRFDMPVMLAASVALLAMALIRQGVPRWLGVIFMMAYVGYIVGIAQVRGFSM